MIGRADIEGSKRNVAMNACAVPQEQLCLPVGEGARQGREGEYRDAPSSVQLRCY